MWVFCDGCHELADCCGESMCPMKTNLFIFVSNSTDNTCPARAPGLCSQFQVTSKLLIYFCCFVCVILVVFFSLLYLSVSRVRPLSLGCIFVVSDEILVPLITLSSIRLRNKKPLCQMFWISLYILRKPAEILLLVFFFQDFFRLSVWKLLHNTEECVPWTLVQTFYSNIQ